MLTSEGTKDHAVGNDPTRPYEARLTPVGTPPVHVTPVQRGEQGLEAVVQPEKVMKGQGDMTGEGDEGSG